MDKLRKFAVFLFAISSFLFTSQAIATHASQAENNASITIGNIETGHYSSPLKPLQNLDELRRSSANFTLANPDAFFSYRRGVLKHGFWELQDWDKCVTTFKKKVNWQSRKDEDSGPEFEFRMFLIGCVQSFLAAGDVDEKYLKDFTELLLHWSSGNDEAFIPPQFNKKEDQWYIMSSFVGNLAQWYAFYHNELDVSSNEKKNIERFIREHLLAVSFMKNLTGNQIPCPKDVSKYVQLLKNVDADFCGSVRWKVATGRLTLGFILDDAELIDKGIKDLDVLIHAYDEDGYFVSYSPAKTGGYSFSYYMRQGIFLSVLTEIIAMRGYDFLAFKLPYGATVKQALDFTFDVAVTDFSQLGKYSQSGEFKRNPRWQWDKVIKLSHEQFGSQIASTSGRYDHVNTAEQFATRNPRYASQYKPEEFILSYKYRDNLVDDFSSISALSLFLGNSRLSREEWSKRVMSYHSDLQDGDLLLQKLTSLQPMGLSLNDSYGFENDLANYLDFNANSDINFSLNNGWSVNDKANIKILSYSHYETIAGQSKEKFKSRFKVSAALPKQNRIYEGTITLYVNGSEIHIGHWAEALVDNGHVSLELMADVKKRCDYDNVDEPYQIMLPLFSAKEMSNSRVPCNFDNAKSDEFQEILKFVLIAGRAMAVEAGIIDGVKMIAENVDIPANDSTVAVNLSNLGVKILPDTRVELIDGKAIRLGKYFLKDTIPAKSENKPTKYRLHFNRVGSQPVDEKPILILYHQKVTLFEKVKSSGTARSVGLDLSKTFGMYPKVKKNWEKIWDQCPFEDDDGFDYLSIPILHNDWLKPLLICLDENVTDSDLRLIIQSLVKIGNKVDVGKL